MTVGTERDDIHLFYGRCDLKNVEERYDTVENVVVYMVRETYLESMWKRHPSESEGESRRSVRVPSDT